jgi:methionyl-tRNA formyltransferase
VKIVYITNNYSPIGAFCLWGLLNENINPELIISVAHQKKWNAMTVIAGRGILFCMIKALEALGMIMRSVLTKLGWRSRRPRSLQEIANTGKCTINKVSDINSPAVRKMISSLSAELIISVCCPQIFSKELLSIPARGCLNVHPGLLPENRGADPTYWTWKLEKAYGGVTVHLMDEGIDTGPIISQERFGVMKADGEAEIREKARITAPKVLLAAIRAIAGNETGKPQSDGCTYPLPEKKPVMNLIGELKYLFCELR